jgi:N-acetylmuramoyl-L-alanine amidase
MREQPSRLARVAPQDATAAPLAPAGGAAQDRAPAARARRRGQRAGAAAHALVLSLCGAAVLSPADAAELRNLALAVAPDGAQLVIEMTGAVGSKVFALKGPDRAVIDLSDTHLAPGVTAVHGGGIVTDVRVGHQPGGVLRVVLQLSAAYPARVAWTAVPGGAGRLLVVSVGTPPRTAPPLARGDTAVAIPVAAPLPPAAALAAATLPDTRARTVAAAHAPASGERDIVIAVDAGHGGEDPGAIGREGTREKDVTLAIATRLATRISREPGMRAVLTRSTDEFVALRDRMRRARASKADLFISVHADASLNREAAGASVYVLSERGASSENARWLAERQNAADLMGGVQLDNKDPTLASVLLDLSQSATISASVTAAERVLASLDGVEEVRKSQVQQAGFVVLKSPDIPSMLVETAYISNPLEERKLRRPLEQDRLAEAIFGGVRRYFLASPPEGTRLAALARAGLVRATP